ncbi:MAG: GNAT family N-acetyltransferase [Firmicutes bacterium]|nr:GNAT family N-acetyltransferase [Bacillota bacterium]
MMKFTMRSTDEYERLVRFFVENQLEFDGDEEVDTDIVKCWKITQGDDYLVAGCVLAKREEEYIIDGIAVDKVMRKTGMGKILVDKVISEVKKLGGERIYLVARAPGFFRKLGFEAIDPSEAPNFFECKQCPQYQVSCHPEVMKLEIE